MAESKELLDQMISKAVAAGTTTANQKQDQGLMYGHGFQDLDGQLRENTWMDMNAIPPQL